MLRNVALSTIFYVLVWLNLGLNPSLLGHWWTIYTLGQYIYIYIYIYVYNLRKTVQVLDLFCRNPRWIGISDEWSMTAAIRYIMNFQLEIYRKSHAEQKHFYKFDEKTWIQYFHNKFISGCYDLHQREFNKFELRLLCRHPYSFENYLFSSYTYFQVFAFCRKFSEESKNLEIHARTK